MVGASLQIYLITAPCISFTVFHEYYHAPTLANGSAAELNRISSSIHLGEMNLTEAGPVSLPESFILCTRARPLLFLLLMLGTLWVGYTLYQFRRRWASFSITHLCTHTYTDECFKEWQKSILTPHLSIFSWQSVSACEDERDSVRLCSAYFSACLLLCGIIRLQRHCLWVMWSHRVCLLYVAHTLTLADIILKCSACFHITRDAGF